MRGHTKKTLTWADTPDATSSAYDLSESNEVAYAQTAREKQCASSQGINRRELVALLKKRFGNELDDFRRVMSIEEKEENRGRLRNEPNRCKQFKSNDEVPFEIYIKSNGNIQPTRQTSIHMVGGNGDDNTGMTDETAPVRPPPPATVPSSSSGRTSSCGEQPLCSASVPCEWRLTYSPQLSATDAKIRHLAYRGVVFLQYKDIVKKNYLPLALRSMDVLKALFVKSFPGRISMSHFEDGYKTIYIKDEETGVFYELEDLTDVLDKSFLKIQETQPIDESLSESELKPQRLRSRAALTRAQTFIYPPEHAQNGECAIPQQDVEVQPSISRRTGFNGSMELGTAVSHDCHQTMPTLSIRAYVTEASDESSADEEREFAPVGRKSSDERSAVSVEDQLDNLTALLKTALEEEASDFAPDSADCRHKTIPGRLDPSFIEEMRKKGEEEAKKSLGRLFQPTALVLAQKEAEKQALESCPSSKVIIRRHATSASPALGSYGRKLPSCKDILCQQTSVHVRAESQCRQTERFGPIVDIKAKTLADDKSDAKLQSVQNSASGIHMDARNESSNNGRTKLTCQNSHTSSSQKVFLNHDAKFSDAIQTKLIDACSRGESRVEGSAVVNGPSSFSPSLFSPSRPSVVATTITGPSRCRAVAESLDSSTFQASAFYDSQSAKAVRGCAVAGVAETKTLEDSVGTTTRTPAFPVIMSAERGKELKSYITIERIPPSHPPGTPVGSKLPELVTSPDVAPTFVTVQGLASEDVSIEGHPRISLGSVTRDLENSSAKIDKVEPKVATSTKAVILSTASRSNLDDLEASAVKLRRGMRDLRTAFGELRLAHISNAYDFKNEMLKGRAACRRYLKQQRPSELVLCDQGTSRVNEIMGFLRAERNSYQSGVEQVQFKLQQVEEGIEELRQQVVLRKRVDDAGKLTTFNERLQDVTQDLACSKDKFQRLHDSLKRVLVTDLAGIVHDDEFMKGEPVYIESLITRVKQASSTLNTMQKLASIQKEVHTSSLLDCPTNLASTTSRLPVKVPSEESFVRSVRSVRFVNGAKSTES